MRARPGHRAADLLAQLHDDPLGRALADPRHRLKAAASPAAIAAKLARRAAESTASATFGPTACTAEQHQEEVALLLAMEAVEIQCVVAHDQVGVQRRLLAPRRTCTSVSAETAAR